MGRTERTHTKHAIRRPRSTLEYFHRQYWNKLRERIPDVTILGVEEPMGTFSPTAGNERYSLMWRECSPGSDLAQRFAMPNVYCWLPFFLSGRDLHALGASPGVELREEHLLKGILYGLFELEHAPKPWTKATDRKVLESKLFVLASGFGYGADIERMILDAGMSVRNQNGNSPARIIYEVGLTICPSSSKIRSDLILALWDIISDSNDRQDLLVQIPTHLAAIDPKAIHPNAREIVFYYGLCALVLLGRTGEADDFRKRSFLPNVSNRQLRTRIDSLTMAPTHYSAAALRIT